MNSINIIEEIKIYISVHRDDCDSDWEYMHTHWITETLKTLNQVECEVLSNKIFEWDEFHLFNIADPILFCENEYINIDSLYIKIFCKLKDIDYLEYLVQNVIHYIRPPYYTKEQIKGWPLDLIKNLKQNITLAMSIKDDSWKEELKKVIEFLDGATAS